MNIDPNSNGGFPCEQEQPAEPPELKRARTALTGLLNEININWRGTQRAPIRAACDDVQLAADFAERVTTEAWTFKHQLWHDVTYLEAFEDLRVTAGYIRGTLRVVDRHGGGRDGSDRMLATHARSLRANLHQAVAAFSEVVKSTSTTDTERESASALAEKFEEEIWTLQEHDSVEDAKQTLWRIQEIYRKFRDLAQQATGDIGANSLGYHYDQYAKREARIANVLRWLVGISVVAIVLLALWFNSRMTEATLAVELVRLSVAIPLAALAAYLGRESTKHREAARWARERAIALHTMPDYAEALKPVDKRMLRQLLGIRVFGLTPDRSGGGPEPSPLDELLGSVQKVTEGLRNLGDTVQDLCGTPEKKPDRPDEGAAK